MIFVCWAEASALDDKKEYPLSDYRVDKLRHISKAEVRRASIGVELLLHKMLRQVDADLALPPRILCAEGGKPYLADCALYFNLSHSGSYVACALSDSPVGVDLQVNTKAQDRLINRVLTEEEREWLLSCEDRDAAFTELWCRKESFLKATGEGLVGGLQSFSVSPGSDKPIYNGEAFKILHRSFPDFHLAVCYPASMTGTIRFEQSELI